MNWEGRSQKSVTLSMQHTTGTPHSAFRTPHSQRAFTMIEIALSLAVIGFALVAIISVLPLGMNAQKENREETIIKQDATVFLNAIRNGARGVDDLTNYVMAITNYYTRYIKGQPMGAQSGYHWYVYNNSSDGAIYNLDRGSNIVGLLSTPKYIYANPIPDGNFLSNHVVAYVRSLSGPASEKLPQTNATVQDLGLSYRMIAEVVPYGTNYYDPSWVNVGQSGLSPAEFIARSNYWMVAKNLQANLHDIRLTFRWPLAKTTNAPGRQVFRTLATGPLFGTNDPIYGPLFFFQPRTYAKAL
jgi:type II secretory pathway pseudopilin PulG